MNDDTRLFFFSSFMLIRLPCICEDDDDNYNLIIHLFRSILSNKKRIICFKYD
jgi:hypothetical protein